MKPFYFCTYGGLQFNPCADPLDTWVSQHVCTWLAGSQHTGIPQQWKRDWISSLLHSERVATVWNFQRRQIAHPTLHRAAQSWAPAVSQWYQQSPKAKGHIPMGFTALFIYPNNWKNLLPLGLKAMQQMGFSWAGKWATMPSLSESSLTRTWEQNRAQD